MSCGRCLLLTDGLANAGITDRDELVSLAGAVLRERRVATSRFGVGSDFDERLLHGMADAAGGHFYFIEQPAQIPDLLTSELGELLTVVARDACITLQLPDGVEAAPLSAFDVVKTDAGIRVGLGDLVSGQELAVVVALQFPAFLDRVRPALVEYQAGMDPFEDDPVGGIAGVDAEFLRFRDRCVIGHIRSRGIPLVINLAGGYLDGVTEHLHLETVRVAVDAMCRQQDGESLVVDAETGEWSDDTLHAALWSGAIGSRGAAMR